MQSPSERQCCASPASSGPPQTHGTRPRSPAWDPCRARSPEPGPSRKCCSRPRDAAQPFNSTARSTFKPNTAAPRRGNVSGRHRSRDGWVDGLAHCSAASAPSARHRASPTIPMHGMLQRSSGEWKLKALRCLGIGWASGRTAAGLRHRSTSTDGLQSGVQGHISTGGARAPPARVPNGVVILCTRMSCKSVWQERNAARLETLLVCFVCIKEGPRLVGS